MPTQRYLLLVSLIVEVAAEVAVELHELVEGLLGLAVLGRALPQMTREMMN